MASGYIFRAIMMSPRISCVAREVPGAVPVAFDDVELAACATRSKVCGCCAQTIEVERTTTGRTHAARRIIILLLRSAPDAYGFWSGLGFGGSAGFLLLPKIPKILCNTDFF